MCWADGLLHSPAPAGQKQSSSLPPRPNPPDPNPTQPGYCASLKDRCYDYRNDADACAADPGCRSVPRCSNSGCSLGDECCLTHSSSECRANPSCASSNYCGLAFSPCWDKYEQAACTARKGCNWQSSSDGTQQWGWCSPITDPCSPASSSPIACAAVLDDERGIPACRFQVGACCRGS